MKTRQVFAVSAVVGTVVLVAALAHAADPASRCEAQKVKAIGKYVGCLANLDAKAAMRGETVDPTATAKCADKFLSSWDKAQVRGEGLCADPPGADASVAQATAALCAAWASGYVQGGDADMCAGACDTCTTDLATCSNGLSTCNGDLTTCSGSLTTCTGSLSAAQSDLAACSGSLASCESVKTQCQADLASCMTPSCGDGRIDAGENCDGTNLAGLACADLGFVSGTLACSPTCAFEIDNCMQCLPALLTNGSFECGPSPGSPGYQTLPLGSTDVCGWVVTDADIDINTTWWVASDGLKSIDLNGTQPGAIAQTFPTIPGRVYEVSFDMAGNTIELRNSTAVMQVTAAGQSATFTVQVGDYPGPPFTQMDWTPKTWSFIANATTTTIEFKSQNLSSGAGGPALDNVRILECS